MSIYSYTHIISLIFRILYQVGKTALGYARSKGKTEVVAYLEAAQVRFFPFIFFPIFILSCKSDYYSLMMITYHISILYSLGCALPVLSEVVRVIFFAC